MRWFEHVPGLPDKVSASDTRSMVVPRHFVGYDGRMFRAYRDAEAMAPAESLDHAVRRVVVVALEDSIDAHVARREYALENLARAEAERDGEEIAAVGLREQLHRLAPPARGGPA